MIGLFIALTSSVEYQSSCKLLTEGDSNGSGDFQNLRGLAGLAGIDLSGTQSNSLSEATYPEIVNSLPFLINVINEPVHFLDPDTVVSSKVYFDEIKEPSILDYTRTYTIGLPFVILDLIKGGNKKGAGQNVAVGTNQSEVLRLNKDDLNQLLSFSDRITIENPSYNGIIKITAEMPDPLAAADLTQLIYKKLTDRVTDYKIEKSRLDLMFIEERFLEAESRFKELQVELALFKDRNKNITSAIFSNELSRIQNEYDVAFEIYKGLSSQLEQAKITVKKETPVFTVIEPPTVPVRKSRPKRLITIIVWSISGGLFSLLYLAASYFLSPIFAQLKRANS